MNQVSDELKLATDNNGEIYLGPLTDIRQITAKY